MRALDKRRLVALRLIVLFSLHSVVALAEQITVAVPEVVLKEDIYGSPHAFALFLRSGIFETLLRESENGGWGLGLASSAQSSADGTRWQLSLKQGRRFSTMAPVAISDVLSSLDLCASRFSLEITSEIGEQGELVVRGAVGGSAQELVKFLTTCPIVEKRSREIFGSFFGSGTHYVGSGPYRILEFQDQQRIYLDRRQGPPGVQRIEIKSFPDPSQALTAVRLGSVDASFSVSDEVLEKARKDETLEVAECSIFYVVLRRGLHLECGQLVDITRFAYQAQSQKAS